MSNPFLPYVGTLVEVRDLAEGIKLLRVRLEDEFGRAAFADYKPGQFAFLSAFGVGEVPFGLAGTPARSPELEFAIARVGTVTSALHGLEEGAPVGIRGPMGNWFPMEDFRGKNLVIIGGGIGFAPLRPVIQYALDRRADYGHLTILAAARAPNLLVFREEYAEWASAPDTEFHVTVDVGDETWAGNVGLVTELQAKVSPSPKNAIAITCGPPIMIKFVTQLLQKQGFAPEQIYTTLEMKMKCGLGKCGRCNIGERYVCIDGPVFSQAQILKFIDAF
ncbi:MAG: FAD/NAD(P)-binding protein [Chloroflexia bacterium]